MTPELRQHIREFVNLLVLILSASGILVGLFCTALCSMAAFWMLFGLLVIVGGWIVTKPRKI